MSNLERKTITDSDGSYSYPVKKSKPKIKMMRKYNVKYEVGQEVYVLRSKKITKTVVDKIRVTEQQPWRKGNTDGTQTEMDGIQIDYLIETEKLPLGGNRTQISYDWFNQEDVFTSKDELITQIV